MSVARIFGSLTFFLLGACRHEPAPGESVDEVCAVANHDQEVAVSGYLVPPFLSFGCVESCSIELTTAPRESDGISLRFPVGSGPGTMKAIEPMKDSRTAGEVRPLSASAYQLTDDDGKVVGPGDVVRAKGTLTATRHDDGRVLCSMDPTSVRAL